MICWKIKSSGNLILIQKNKIMKKLKHTLLILFEFMLLLIFVSSCNNKESVIMINAVDSGSNPQKVGTPTGCDWTFQYVDNFNNANNNNDYGLNDNLPKRQLYGDWKNTTWIRKGGAWYTHTIHEWYSQVNHPFIPNVLTFHSDLSSVMLNKVLSTGTAGKYRVSFTTNPGTNEQSSEYWTSFMLNSNSAKEGWVTGTNFGFLICSNGGVQVFQNGNSKTVTGTVPAASKYQVVLDISPGSLIATINDVQLTATLNESIPTSAYAFLGANIDSANPIVSSFDDLVINTQYQTASKRIQNYGYYWVSSSSYGDHFSEVADYTNFNFIESITSATPNTKTNVLQVRWQFWSDNTGILNPNWLANWNALLTTINQNANKIKAIYLFDEPFWAVPVSLTDYNMVLNRVKTDLPNIPIISVFAYPTVNDLADTRIANVTNSLDWIGADEYVPVSNFSEITNLINILGNKRPDNNIFLIPQTDFEGTTTDADVAAINWMFYNMALSNPRVIGLWNFGLWSSTTPSQVPITLEVQKLIGKAITAY